MSKVAKRNAAYERMTPARRRVAVAKDALELLEAGRIEAGHSYFKGPTVQAYQDGLSIDLRDAILATDETCRVCGIGSLFVAMVLQTNGTKVTAVAGRRYREPLRLGEDLDDRDLWDHMADVFDQPQLGLIEAAYEGYAMWDPLTQDGVSAFDVIRSDQERMRRILQNIVRNEGTFVCTAEEAAK